MYDKLIAELQNAIDFGIPAGYRNGGDSDLLAEWLRRIEDLKEDIQDYNSDPDDD